MKYILIFIAIYFAISLYPKFRQTVINMYNYKKPVHSKLKHLCYKCFESSYFTTDGCCSKCFTLARGNK